MGFLNNDSSIITVDAVVTDLGRQLLSRGDGSFNIARYSFGDDEIDYSLFNPNTDSLQQDTEILNTPIFEASVNEKLALKNQLISIPNPSLKYLPKLESTIPSISLGERNDAQVGKVLEFRQTSTSGRTIPSEIIDATFIVQMHNDLLFIASQSPVSITPFGTAQYTLPRTALNANQGAQITFSVVVQSIPADLWNSLGVGTLGSRTISTTVRVQGALSGLNSESTVVITEQFTR